MPIEDIKIQRAPAGWQPNRDQQMRIQTDPRLQRMSRDDLYYAMQNRPASGTRAATPVKDASVNAMSWHPREIFNYVASTLRNATGR